MEVREPSARYLTDAGTQLTEIGALPKDWSVVPLASLADKIMVGIASAATHAYRSTGVTMFRNQNIRAGLLDTHDVLYIDPQYEQTYKNKRLKAGDLLTARTGYPGTTSLVPAGFDGAQSFTTLITRPRPSAIDPQYLCLYINGRAGQRYFEQAQIGGGQKNVNAASLKLLPVAIPSTDTEQRAIARALTDADALIDSLQQLLTKKRQIKQAAMQELLTGKRRLPGFIDAWEESLIGEFTDCTAGGTPSTREDRFWGGPIPWMSSGDLHLKRIHEVDGRITDEGLNNSSTKWIPERCVLIGLAGQGKTRGTVAMNFIPLCTNQSIAAIFPCESYDTDFLYHNLDGRYEELRELSAGDGGRGGLNLTLIRSITVPRPSMQEQQAIARALSDMDTGIDTLESRLTKALALKQAMAQALLTGRIRLVAPTA
jgi:type I restriction enzyme, S subunit